MVSWLIQEERSEQKYLYFLVGQILLTLELPTIRDLFPLERSKWQVFK